METKTTHERFEYLALNERYEKAISLLESAADKLQFKTPSGRNDSLAIEIYEFLEELKQARGVRS